MSDYTGENLSRLMADRGLSMHQVAERAALDERTIRGILNGSNRPHPKTLRRLADGLGVKVDEFFVDPARLLYRRFDRQTNPIVAEVLETHGDLFDGWTEGDFDELHSRVGTGGPMTVEGALRAVREMNLKHDLYENLDLLVECGFAEPIARFFEALRQTVAVSNSTAEPRTDA